MGCGASNDVKLLSVVDQSIWRGTLYLEIKEAKINKFQNIYGKMDPYVKLQFVAEDGSLEPKWDQKFTITRYNEDDLVLVQLWNKNLITIDNYIGESAFSLLKVKHGSPKPSENEENNVNFIDLLTPIYSIGQIIGYLKIRMQFELDKSSKLHPEVLAPNVTGQLSVKPIQANITRDILVYGQMDILLTICVGEEKQNTSVNENCTKNPTWKNNYIFKRDLQDDLIYFELWNFNDQGQNDLIGVGFASITPALPKNSKIKKTVILTFEGIQAGTIDIEFELISNQKQNEANDNNDNNNDLRQIQNKLVEFKEEDQQKQKQEEEFVKFPTTGKFNYQFQNGDINNGEYLNGLRHGLGKCIYKSGMVYEGMWSNDNWNGFGTLKLQGTSYEGEFLNGKKHGQGTIIWDSGQQYRGEWANNNYNGIGFWKFLNGTEKMGYFEKGSRIKWLDQQQNFLSAGKVLSQGGFIDSKNGNFTLMLANDGRINIFNNFSGMIQMQIIELNKNINPPFHIKLDQTGILQAIDKSGQPYYSSKPLENKGIPPYKLIIEDDGILAIYDYTRQCINIFKRE